MAHEQLAIQHFKVWLPGELVYSAQKASYARKLERAQRPADDSTSMVNFLGQEWEHFRDLKSKGAHYRPDHAKSAQQQIVKFAAGIFDKIAVAKWLEGDTLPIATELTDIASETANKVIDAAPWDNFEADEELFALPFEDTPFAESIEQIAEGLSASVSGPQTSTSRLHHVQEIALDCGGQVVALYGKYADENLKKEQLLIPASQLSESI